LLSTPREPDLDRITRFAKYVFQSDMALISLIDHDRQWFKSSYGIDAAQAPRDTSFCAHAIHQDGPFIVNNALEDPRFHDNPFVTGDPNLRFYAGHPLSNREGYRVGTLCVASSQAREFSDADAAMLRDLGRMVEIIFEHRKLNHAQSELISNLAAAERDRLIDPLSGLWNRRGLDQLFEREIVRCQQLRHPVGVAMVDIDHFKSVNDRYGHLAGDQALKLAAQLLLESVRDTDVVARFGGEEFAIILPGADADNLPMIGEKILREFRARARIGKGAASPGFTVSVGFGVTPADTIEDARAQDLLAAADDALYRAKRGGRDRFEIATRLAA